MNEAIRAQALAWLQSSPLLLDTETTGMCDDAEILEIGIVDVRVEAPWPA